MKSHPRFKIPLTWGHLTHFMGLVQEAWVVEKLSSDTLVIPLTRGPMFPYTVARVHGAWSPHIPDKTPHYRVKHEYDLFGVTRENVEEHHTVRLAQVQVGAHLLVEMPARRSQLCIKDKGLWHGVMWAEGKSGSTHTYCGEKVYGVVSR